MLSVEAQKNKNYEQALRELEKAIVKNENNYLYYYDKGKIEYILKKYEDAISSFKNSMSLNDSFAQTCYNLGLSYVKIGNENEALIYLTRSTKINQNYEKGYLEIARVYNRLGKFEQCVKAYETVIQKFQNNFQAMMELGSVYYQNGKLAEAEKQYKSALSKLQKSEMQTLTEYNLSTVLFDERKYEEAQNYARLAYEKKDFISNNSAKANIVYNYALIENTLGKTEAAIKLYNETLTLNPNHVKAMINLASSMMTLKNPDFDRVYKLLLQAYSANKDNFEVNNNLGSYYILKNDFANAVAFYEKASKIKPNDTEVQSNLGNAYLKNGNLEEAKRVFNELISKNAKDWDSYVNLAKVYIQLRDKENARKNLLFVKVNRPDFRTEEVNSLILLLVEL